MNLSGVISDRIRGLLASGKLDASAINPGRPADVAPTGKPPKLPKHVQGQPMTGRHRRDK